MFLTLATSDLTSVVGNCQGRTANTDLGIVVAVLDGGRVRIRHGRVPGLWRDPTGRFIFFDEFHVGDSKKPPESFPKFCEFFERDAF